jgi:uncharacterized protein YjbI with pentapeptide repeats
MRAALTDRGIFVITILNLKTGDVIMHVPSDTLSGFDLGFAHLQDADLRNAQMDATRCAGAHLSGADLSNALLLSANFYSAHLVKTVFQNANLTGADFEGANLQNADFVSASLGQVQLRHASLTGADFSHANMKAANLSHATVGNACFRDADLEETIFYRTRLKNADFTGAMFSKTVFADCPTLPNAIGLADALYDGTVSIDISTISHCIETLPTEFLLGCGLTPQQITDIKNWKRLLTKADSTR